MKLGQQSVMNGLSSDQVTIKTAGTYSVFSRTSCVEPSSIVVTLSQSGSASASFASPAATAQQEHVEMNARFACQVGDLLQVSVTSAASPDQPPSLIKTVINIKQGV